jgi:Do/DeqQ family serine protease
MRGRLAAVGAAAVLAVGAAAWHVQAQEPAVTPDTGVAAATGSGTRILGNGTDSYAPVVSRVAPAVVTVRSEQRTRTTSQRMPFLDDPRFRDFFGDRFGEDLPIPQPRRGGLGSGVLVSQDGYILTNHHVIANADKVQIELQDRRTFPAKIVGSDEPSDLAVLKIEATGLPVVSFGDSEVVHVGDIVLALGNPMGVGQTVTMGIISAKGRATGLGDGSFEDFLQTDAPINTGNSGGALVNTHGQLIGINSQILSPSGGNIGIGFAIPVNMARAVMDALVEHGEVRRGRLGVVVQPVTSDLATSLRLESVAGALVNEVQADGAAARAGLRRGDVIVALNGIKIADTNELRNRIAALGPDVAVELSIVRDGKAETVRATLGALPSKSAATPAGRPSEGERLAGLSVEPLTAQRARQLGLKEGEGVIVTGVDPSGPAADAGLRTGDVIQQIDGRSIASAAELRKALDNGDRPALVLVRRGEQSLFVALDRTA